MAPRIFYVRRNVNENVNENVEREAPKPPFQAPQVLVDLLAEQVTTVEFRSAFHVLAQAMTTQENREVIVPRNSNVGSKRSDTTPWDHPKGPEEDPNPWPSKLPRQLEVVYGGSGSASRTCSTKGQKVWSASRTRRGVYYLGQNVQIRLPETTLRVPEEDPTLGQTSCQGSLKLCMEGMAPRGGLAPPRAKRFGPRRGHIADSTVS
uniref:Integrase core domain containing protein n=1 Tax=Solanum tuberosum TaxID=4113 RepID=M1DVZ6_SOLTU